MKVRKALLNLFCYGGGEGVGGGVQDVPGSFGTTTKWNRNQVF